DAVDPQEVADVVFLLVVEIGDVDMADAGVAPFGFPWWPTHQLDAREPFVGGEFQHFFQGQVGQDGADEAEVHGGRLRARSVAPRTIPQPFTGRDDLFSQRLLRRFGPDQRRLAHVVLADVRRHSALARPIYK